MTQNHPTKSLRSLLVTQFVGAFMDNAWKLYVAFFLVRTAGGATLTGAEFDALNQQQTTLTFVVFTLPLMLFSLPACTLADRIAKRDLIVGVKALELVLMLAATLCLWQAPDGRVGPLVILGLLGLQSALFSPAKYGILPEILPHDRLSAGNGALELWTFLAIIGGMVAGGGLADVNGWQVGAMLTVVSGLGLAMAVRIPRSAATGGSESPAASLKGAWQVIRGDRVLRLSLIGGVFFWTLASLVSQDVLVYTRSLTFESESSKQLASLALAVLGVGVGAGAVLAGRLSRRKVELGLIPLGAVGLGGFTLVLGLLAPGYGPTLVLLALMGVSSGLLVVPLNALQQWRPPASRRGAVIAFGNFFVFAGVLAGTLSASGLASLGWSPRWILAVAGVATFAGTVWALWLLPEALLRLLLVLLTNTFYRLKVRGRHHVPHEGGALLVPNHVSFIDGLLLIASNDRDIRFIVAEEYYRHRLLKYFMKWLKAIPVRSGADARVVLRALRDAGRYLDQGELVCIFPEGQLTRTGLMQPFRRGIERIARGRDVPIIPVHLDRVWGSIFSRSGGRFFTKLPERIPYPVTVSYGEPVPSSTPLHELRRAILDLGAEAFIGRKADRRPLHRTFIHRVRRRPWAFAMADARTPGLSRWRALAGAIALARALRETWGEDRRVGILLPPGVPGALVNAAAALSGRTSVNLNYTAGPEAMGSAARQAGFTRVVTARAFLKLASLELPDGLEPVFLEDLPIRGGARLQAALLALLAPVRWIERACGMRDRTAMDDVATIIFSSGSTGDPKGVLLTHFNIDSNVEGATQVLHVNPSDRLLGILPLFHSFGTLSLWFSLNRGMGLIFHANPLDAGAVGELVERYRVTLLLATPTFLQLYRRRCKPEQFGSLRLVVTGAEKLSQDFAQEFKDVFGIEPLEGYGATECAPVIAVSAPDFRAAGFYQPGSRRGFVGQPLPGVSLRVVDPEAPDPVHATSLPPGEEGLLLVRGPNVMQGYLGREDLTRQVKSDGWYVTGDIALVDGDGFLRITDRLSRFSKIGGEMVPHGKVEETLQKASGSVEQVLAVTAIEDPRKGEQLAVLHTLDEGRIPQLIEAARRSGLPNLFLPREDRFVHVDELPLLGTGKLDLRRLRELAREHLEGS